MKLIFIALLFSFALFSNAQDTCQVCVQIATFLKAEVSNNVSDQKIQQDLLNICKTIPAPFGDQCTAYVNANFPTLIDLIKKIDNPQVVCQQLGLCPSKVAVQAINKCSVCTLLVGVVETYIETNATETKILGVLDKVCTFLPSGYAAVCKTVIDSYGLQLIQKVLDKENPDTVCNQIKMCPAALATTVKAVSCSTCKLVVGLAEHYITENATETKIISAAEKLCAILPGSIASECKSFVDVYLPAAIQLLINKETPESVCTLLRFCTAARTLFHAIPVQGAGECTVCKLVVGLAEHYVTQNATESKIIFEAEKLCSILPSALSGICKSFVDKYLPAAIQMLINKENPDAVCTSLRMCTSSKVTLKAKAGSACDICQLVVAAAENFLSSNATQAEVVALGEKICNALPVYQAQCKNLVDNVLPEAIKYILNKESPAVACAQLKLCSANAVGLRIQINH